MFFTKNIKCCTDRNSLFNYSINLKHSLNEMKTANNENMNQELPINKPQYYNDYNQDINYNYNNIMDSNYEDIQLNSNIFKSYNKKIKDSQNNSGISKNSHNNNRNNSITKNSNRAMIDCNSKNNSNSRITFVLEKNKNNIDDNFPLNNNEPNNILRNKNNNFNNNLDEEKSELKRENINNLTTNTNIDLGQREDKQNNIEKDKKKTKIMDRINRARAKSSDIKSQKALKSENILMKVKILEKFIGNIKSHENLSNNDINEQNDKDFLIISDKYDNAKNPEN